MAKIAFYADLMTVPGTGQGWATAHAQPGDQLSVGELLVGPHTTKVKDLPEAHSKGPHVRLGGVASLQEKISIRQYIDYIM